MKIHKFWSILLFTAALVVAACVFAPVLRLDSVLLAPDSPADISQPGFYRRLVAWLLTGSHALSHDAILRIVCPSLVYHELSFAVSAALTALALAVYLRILGLSVCASSFGGLFLAFSGYNFTLFNAGHRGYAAMMPYAVFMFALLECALRSPRWHDFVLLAACVVCGLSEQPDVMAFMLMLAAAYSLVRMILLARETGARVYFKSRALRFALGAVLFVVVGVAFGYGTLKNIFSAQIAGRDKQIREASEVLAVESSPDADAIRKREQWIFATNWSLPPEAAVEFVAPSVRGFDSGNNKGPYWGRLGESATFSKDGKGFANFRQHSLYLGAIGVVLALFAVIYAILCLVDNRATKDSGAKTGVGANAKIALFWGVAAIVVFALALGRYAPFYRVFYALPLMDKVRAPVKFVHLLEVCVAVLAGFGISHIEAPPNDSHSAKVRFRRAGKIVIFASCAVAAIMIASVAKLFEAKRVAAFAARGLLTGSQEIDGQLARMFNANWFDAVSRGAWLIAVAAFAVGLSAFSKSAWRAKIAKCAAWAVGIVGVVDLANAAMPYVQAQEASRCLAADSVVVKDVIKDIPDADGYAFSYILTTQRPIPGSIITPFSTLKALGMQCADPEAQDAQDGLRWRTFSGVPGGMPNYARHWAFWGVSHIFAPSNVAKQFVASKQARLVAAYDPVQGGFVRHTSGNPEGAVFMLSPMAVSPHLAVFHQWRVATGGDKALADVACEPYFDLARQIVVESEPEGIVQSAADPIALAWTVSPKRSGRCGVVDAELSEPGLLYCRSRILRQMMPAVKAVVNGKRIKVLRTHGGDFAVPVPAGKLHVEIFPDVPWGTLVLALCAVSLVVAALFCIAFKKTAK